MSDSPSSMTPPATWEIPQLLRPPAAFPAGEISADGLRPLYYEGPPFRGRPTRVFAFYGAPKAAGKAPGIVLVHGGLGTAYADWVRLWNSRGYAAIAFDHGGHLPVKENGEWKINPDGGPLMDDGKQVRDPVPDQWMHHAVADTVLAHSLLRSFPEVDAERTGITGISWGGVVTSIAVTLDPRFRFAAPVYGCGFISTLNDTGDCFVGRDFPPGDRALWNALWDPEHFLARVRLPMLWVNGTNDFAFTPGAWQRSYRTAPGPRHLSLKVRMPHGHGGPGESPEEIRAFADSVVGGGAGLPRIVEQGRDWLRYESPGPIHHAGLNYTEGRGPWQEREWKTIPAELLASSRTVRAKVPAGASAWYFNLTDEQGLVISSEHEASP
ncbi:MAG TPA: acetylxylan esterase, partial [Chthoniobacterales bacterium]